MTDTPPGPAPARDVPVLIGGDEMARIDEAAQQLGLAQDALMEAAGTAVTEIALAGERRADAALPVGAVAGLALR